MQRCLKLAGIVLLATLAGCSLLDYVRGPQRSANALRVGTTGDYPPFSLARKGALKGTLEGIEIDLAHSLAEELGRSVEIYRFPLPDLIGELNAGKIDVIMTGLSITKRRAELVDFADPYLEVGQMALVRKADEEKFLGVDWTTIDGLRVGFERATTGAKFVRKNLDNMVPVEFASKGDALQALRGGSIDVMVHDAPFVWLITGSPQEPSEELLGRYTLLTDEKLAWAVRKDDDDLQARLNGVVHRWKESGRIDEILDRWIKVRKVSLPIPPQ